MTILGSWSYPESILVEDPTPPITIVEGSLADRIFNILDQLGYEGSLQDKQYYYLQSQLDSPNLSLSFADLQVTLSLAPPVREILEEIDY